MPQSSSGGKDEGDIGRAEWPQRRRTRTLRFEVAPGRISHNFYVKADSDFAGRLLDEFLSFSC